MPAINAINHVCEAGDPQLLLLQTLRTLLDQASESLRNGDPAPLAAASREIKLNAEEVARLLLQLESVSSSIEVQSERRKLLANVAQQKAFCRAMLRRWRRSLMLRQQLLNLQTETEPDSGYVQLGGFQ